MGIISTLEDVVITGYVLNVIVALSLWALYGYEKSRFPFKEILLDMIMKDLNTKCYSKIRWSLFIPYKLSYEVFKASVMSAQNPQRISKIMQMFDNIHSYYCKDELSENNV